MDNVIHTKYGNAKIGDNGYYRITSVKEGNNMKLLHRLIYEDFYGHIPKDFEIHYINNNKLDNCILNLQLMKTSEHRKLHVSGEKNPHYGKKMSIESRKKMSDAKKGKKQTIEWCKQRSIPSNKTGIMRLFKMKSKQYEQGFVWRYRYYDGEDRKSISSMDLFKLKEEVLDKDLEWIILDEEKAKETMNYAKTCLEN